MEESKIQDIRDGFDEIFLGQENEISDKSKKLFTTLGIEGFAEIIARSKKYGFNVSQSILQDLVKVSLIVYSNLDNLPIKRKVILPETNGSYKFIVTSLPHLSMRGESEEIFKKEATNVLFLVSTGDQMHSQIAQKMGLKSKYIGETNILGGAWIDIDHDKQLLNIRRESGLYSACSNQIIEWMLKEYETKGYKITTGMSSQRGFFEEK